MTSNVTCPSTTKVNSNDITVQVNSLSAPAVSIAGPTTTLCSGQSLTYTATPTNGGSAPAYQWKVNGNNAGTNSSSFTTTLAGGDIVTCVMTSNSACASVPTANSNSLTITSAVTPTISINSPTTSICAGESLTFTASITNGGSNPSLQWFKNGFAVSGQNGTSYSSSSFINGDQIYCELTSNAPCANPTKVNSNTKTITIVTSVIPTVSISTTATTICAGTNLTFTASPKWWFCSYLPMEN
ncbi:MAG: hypothetical protein IPK03_01200 [Bacteroidetes bacterium]|nr:hypothetical protein [Bacteroidota bacterium]